MRQILHIFVKDTRHLWIEIVLSLTITGTLVLVSPQRYTSWTVGGGDISFSSTGGSVWLWAFVLTVLVPISWWMLISSAIHEERLVGDRQFWLTRPYEWPKLLAAKLLFLAVFIYVPLFLAQAILLARAGFNPIAYLAGILYNVLVISVSVIIPLVAIATLTKNFARMTLVILAMIVCFIGISDLSSRFLVSGIATPVGFHISQALFATGCIAVALLQYATRKTAAGWTLLAITLILITTIACIPPDLALMDRKYPAASEKFVELAYRNEPSAGFTATAVESARQINIGLPVSASGIRPGSVIIPEAVKVSIDAPGGFHWTSVWQPIDMGKLQQDQAMSRASFSVPVSIYQQLKSSDLHVHLVLALARADQAQTTRLSMPLTEFKVPGFATCNPLGGVAYKPDEIGALVCRSAIWQPPLTMAQVEWSYDDCRTTSPETRHDIQGAAWVGSLDKHPAEYGVSPVWDQPIPFSNRMPNYPVREPQHICPGTPVTFTTYKLAGRAQTSFDIQSFRLPELSHTPLPITPNQ